MTYSDVLRIRPFRSLWLGQAISQLGDAFYFVIFMFMVKKITNDDAMVGFVGAVDTLPFLLFSMVGGTLADRMDRKKLMVASDIICGVALSLFAAVIALNATPPVWTIFVIAFTLSTVRVFFFPAKNAAIPALVPPESLMTANSLSAATQNVMPMISLSLSASVLALLYDSSPSLFFLCAVAINSVSFFASAAFLATLPTIKPDRERAEVHPAQDMVEGLRYLGTRHVLKVLMCLQGSLTLLISPFFVVYVAANEQWFGGKPSTLAWFECSFFVAMVFTSILVGRMNVKRAGQGFIWGLATVGLAVVAMAFTRDFWVFLGLQFVCGVAVPFADIPMATYIQSSTPDAFRGRVNSVLNIVRIGLAPIGYSLGGVLVQNAGLANAFIIMGIGMAGSALGGLVDAQFRTLRINSPSKAVEAVA